MKKLFCMIALGAISFGSVVAAAPLIVGHSVKMQPDTIKRTKKKVRKNGTTKIKVKKQAVKH